MKPRAITFALAVLGTLLLSSFDLPLPFLFGPLFACLIAALLGVPLKGVKTVSTGARTILGVSVGASLTPVVVQQLPSMALSVAFVPIYIVLIGTVGFWYFHRIVKYDRATAYYAAMPGGLIDMVTFGQEAGADVRALSLIHATRVLLIVTSAPVILIYGFGASLDHPIGVPAATLPPHEMVIMCAAALLGWKGGQRLGLIGASILGPLILTAILSLTDVIHSRPPEEALLFAQFFIGMGVGVHYAGVTVQEVRRFILSGVLQVMILAVLAALFSQVVYALGLAKPIEGFLAFAPGGQAEMTMLSIVVGADLGYVIVHHLSRMVLVILGSSLVFKVLYKPIPDKEGESSKGSRSSQRGRRR